MRNAETEENFFLQFQNRLIKMDYVIYNIARYLFVSTVRDAGDALFPDYSLLRQQTIVITTLLIISSREYPSLRYWRLRHCRHILYCRDKQILAEIIYMTTLDTRCSQVGVKKMFS